jgi:hypothetical protein
VGAILALAIPAHTPAAEPSAKDGIEADVTTPEPEPALVGQVGA